MGRITARLFGHTGWVQAVAFRDDGDGSTLASVDDDTVCVWNIFSGNCLHRFPVRISFFRFVSNISFV
jgi:WD40 repeat protein